MASSAAPLPPPADPSLPLWMMAGMVGLLGAWAYVEYLRRVRHDGPVLARREWLLAALALGLALWGSMVVALSARGLPFDIGFDAPRLAASLALPLLLVLALSYGVVALPRLWMHALLALLFAAGVVATDMVLLWSMGPAPGLAWKREPLAVAALVLALGFGVSVRMVILQRRGSPGDRPGRRFGAALLLAAALAAGLELVALSSDLGRQSAALHARQLPEMAVALAAGGAVPLLLLVMLVDQRVQARIRAANRHRTSQRKRKVRSAASSRKSSKPALEPATTRALHRDAT